MQLKAGSEALIGRTRERGQRRTAGLDNRRASSCNKRDGADAQQRKSEPLDGRARDADLACDNSLA